MTTYNTGNPLGSSDPRDLYDNAEKLDVAVNSDGDTFQDRLGKSRLTWAGMESGFGAGQVSREQMFRTFIASSGYQFVGDYAADIEITEYNQLVRDENGEFWRVSGQVDLPYVTTGAGIPEGDALVPAGDAVLRQDLANPDKGAALVRGAVIYVDTIADLQSLDTSGLVDGQLAALSRGGAYYFNGSAWVSWGAGKFVHPSMEQSAIQGAMDSLENGESLTFLPGQYSGLVKDESLSGFPNNDQPCLLLRGKVGVKIYGAGAVLSTDTHAQGILELQECAFCYIEGLEVVGAGNFPELDGSTGRGEKGSSTAGYQTTGFWGYYKNNSRNTSADDRGGFGGNFPQWGGGTSSTWGVWNGGFIGNLSYGILIHNDCHHIKLSQCKASGFNYVGIGVGHNGDFHPTDLGYPESTNIVFEDCVGTGNYSAGAHAMHVDGFTLSRGEYSYSGHPNANLETDASHNPGYGVTLRGSANFAKNAVITGGKYHNNVRKGIDSHASQGVNISENKVYDNGICGIYVAHTNTAQLAEESIIAANRLRGNAFGNSGLMGSIYVGGNAAGQTIGDMIVSNNVILYGGGDSIQCRYLSHVMITGNKIRGALQAPGNTHIIVLAEASGFEHDIQVTGNAIWDDTGFKVRGIQLSNIRDSLLSGNKIVMTGDISAGIYTPGCQRVDVLNNSSRLGSTGTPISINQAYGQVHGNIVDGGDNPSNIYVSAAAQRIPRISNSFSFRINFNGTATPSITNVTATETVGSASSIEQGVYVNLNGIPSNSRLNARFAISSSGGLVVSGVTDNPFIYFRALSNARIEIGLKATPSGAHLTAQEFTSGELVVTVEIS